MGETYDFCAYRASHLPEILSRQMARVREDLANRDAHLLAVDERLEKYAEVLKSINLELQKHRLTCEKSQALNEECEEALTQDDLDQLIELRDRLTEALLHRA